MSQQPLPQKYQPWDGPFILVSLHPGEPVVGPFSTRAYAESYLARWSNGENYIVRKLIPPADPQQE